MNRVTVFKVTNLLLFISVLAQTFTGIVLFFDLFTGKARFFEMIVQTHRYNGLILTALVTVHIILNWGWIKNQFFRRSAG